MNKDQAKIELDNLLSMTRVSSEQIDRMEFLEKYLSNDLNVLYSNLYKKIHALDDLILREILVSYSRCLVRIFRTTEYLEICIDLDTKTILVDNKQPDEPINPQLFISINKFMEEVNENRTTGII